MARTVNGRMMKSTIPLDAAPNKVAGPHSNIGDASVYLVVFNIFDMPV